MAYEQFDFLNNAKKDVAEQNDQLNLMKQRQLARYKLLMAMQRSKSATSALFTPQEIFQPVKLSIQQLNKGRQNGLSMHPNKFLEANLKAQSYSNIQTQSRKHPIYQQRQNKPPKFPEMQQNSNSKDPFSQGGRLNFPSSDFTKYERRQAASTDNLFGSMKEQVNNLTKKMNQFRNLKVSDLEILEQKRQIQNILLEKETHIGTSQFKVSKQQVDLSKIRQSLSQARQNQEKRFKDGLINGVSLSKQKLLESNLKHAPTQAIAYTRMMHSSKSDPLFLKQIDEQNEEIQEKGYGFQAQNIHNDQLKDSNSEQERQVKIVYLTDSSSERDDAKDQQKYLSEQEELEARVRKRIKKANKMKKISKGQMFMLKMKPRDIIEANLIKLNQIELQGQQDDLSKIKGTSLSKRLKKHDQIIKKRKIARLLDKASVQNVAQLGENHQLEIKNFQESSQKEVKKYYAFQTKENDKTHSNQNVSKSEKEDAEIETETETERLVKQAIRLEKEQERIKELLANRNISLIQGQRKDRSHLRKLVNDQDQEMSMSIESLPKLMQSINSPHRMGTDFESILDKQHRKKDVRESIQRLKENQQMSKQERDSPKEVVEQKGILSKVDQNQKRINHDQEQKKQFQIDSPQISEQTQENQSQQNENQENRSKDAIKQQEILVKSQEKIIEQKKQEISLNSQDKEIQKLISQNVGSSDQNQIVEEEMMSVADKEGSVLNQDFLDKDFLNTSDDDKLEKPFPRLKSSQTDLYLAIAPIEQLEDNSQPNQGLSRQMTTVKVDNQLANDIDLKDYGKKQTFKSKQLQKKQTLNTSLATSDLSFEVGQGIQKERPEYEKQQLRPTILMSLDGSVIQEQTEQQDTTDLKTSYFSLVTRQQTKPLIQADLDKFESTRSDRKTKTIIKLSEKNRDQIGNDSQGGEAKQEFLQMPKDDQSAEPRLKPSKTVQFEQKVLQETNDKNSDFLTIPGQSSFIGKVRPKEINQQIQQQQINGSELPINSQMTKNSNSDTTSQNFQKHLNQIAVDKTAFSSQLVHQTTDEIKSPGISPHQNSGSVNNNSMVSNPDRDIPLPRSFSKKPSQLLSVSKIQYSPAQGLEESQIQRNEQQNLLKAISIRQPQNMQEVSSPLIESAQQNKSSLKNIVIGNNFRANSLKRSDTILKQELPQIEENLIEEASNIGSLLVPPSPNKSILLSGKRKKKKKKRKVVRMIQSEEQFDFQKKLDQEQNVQKLKESPEIHKFHSSSQKSPVFLRQNIEVQTDLEQEQEYGIYQQKIEDPVIDKQIKNQAGIEEIQKNQIQEQDNRIYGQKMKIEEKFVISPKYQPLKMIKDKISFVNKNVVSQKNQIEENLIFNDFKGVTNKNQLDLKALPSESDINKLKISQQLSSDTKSQKSSPKSPQLIIQSEGFKMQLQPTSLLSNSQSLVQQENSVNEESMVKKSTQINQNQHLYEGGEKLQTIKTIKQVRVESEQFEKLQKKCLREQEKIELQNQIRARATQELKDFEIAQQQKQNAVLINGESPMSEGKGKRWRRIQLKPASTVHNKLSEKLTNLHSDKSSPNKKLAAILKAKKEISEIQNLQMLDKKLRIVQTQEKELKETQIVSEQEQEHQKQLKIDGDKTSNKNRLLTEEQFMAKFIDEIKLGNEKQKAEKIIKVGVQRIFTTHDVRYDLPDVVDQIIESRKPKTGPSLIEKRQNMIS